MCACACVYVIVTPQLHLVRFDWCTQYNTSKYHLPSPAGAASDGNVLNLPRGGCKKVRVIWTAIAQIFIALLRHNISNL